MFYLDTDDYLDCLAPSLGGDSEDDEAPPTWRPRAAAPAATRTSPQFDGCKCGGCGDWFAMAEPNRADGGFTCRLCKQNPYRSSPLS